MRAISATGAVLQTRLGDAEGPGIAEAKIQGSKEWNEIKAPVSGLKPGIQDLVLSLKEGGQVEVDWISFE